MIAKIIEKTPNKVVLEYTAEQTKSTIVLTREEFIELTKMLNRLYFESYA